MTGRRRAGLVAALAVAGLLAGCSGGDADECPDPSSACAPPSPGTPTGTEPSYSARNDFPSPDSTPSPAPTSPAPPVTPGPLVPEPSTGLPVPIPTEPVN